MQNKLKSVHCDLLQRTEAFFVSQYIRNRSSIDSAHIFSDNSRELSSTYTQITSCRPLFIFSSQMLNKQTIFYQLASSLLRMMMKLVLKGTKCGIILTEALEDNNNSLDARNASRSSVNIT